MSRRIVVVCVVLFLLAAAGSLPRAEQAASGRDQIWRLRITEVFREYDPTPDKNADPLILHITFTDPLGRLLENVSVKLRHKDDETGFDPVRPGIFTVELSRSLRRKGGMLEMKVKDYWGLVETHIRSTAAGMEPDGPLVPEILSSEGMSVVREEGTAGAVFYNSPDREELARQVLELLGSVRGAIETVLGSEPIQPFEIVLTDRESPQVLEGPGQWPYAYNRETLRQFQGAMVRAWVGATLERVVNLHADRRNRYVFEGIVEWVSLRVLETVGHGDAGDARTAELREAVATVEGGVRPTFNLTGFTWPLARGFVEGRSMGLGSGTAPGTGVSLAFFLKLSRRHGDDIIRRLVDSMASMREGARTANNLIDAVEALTGEKYKLEIRSFSLLEAESFLESAGKNQPAGE